MQYQSCAPTQRSVIIYEFQSSPFVPTHQREKMIHGNNNAGNNNRALSHSARREREKDDLSNAGNLLKRSSIAAGSPIVRA
jgi:hypothetical protein